MLHFDSDYMEGAHPAIIERLAQTNLTQTPGYGTDAYCAHARQLIRDACKAEQAQVHFLVGGTQANAVVISALLEAWQGVLSAESGHVNVHEAGAIEAGGHKVITVPSSQGKVSAQEVRAYMASFESDDNHEHMVEPGMVYISHPTEFGTLYTRKELADLRAACDEGDLRLFVDGARLGYGLAAHDTDVALDDIAHCADAFTIGGTKVGALCGEAVVFPRPDVVSHFFTQIKQQGALLAKGRLLGIQFEVLFEDGLYERIGRHAVDQALRIRTVLVQHGYDTYVDSPTNQQFAVVDSEQRARIAKSATFGFIEPLSGNRSVIRFATSWATRKEDVDELLTVL